MRIQSIVTGAVVFAALAPAGTVVQAQGPKFRESISVRATSPHAHGELKLTFSGPVALPGIALGPGTYIFRRPSNNAVQVASETGEPYQMFITIPTVRAAATRGYSIVLGAPASPDSPPRIIALFGPGEETGQQFVYPR
ncbi:MAG TPA: hypothetical protein VM032_09150 [Vicinamibacterales bacterium]|nr:hypothetical protein [Vicinamibacterales bacterium]